MQYRSFADMNSTIIRSRHRLPDKIDLVVGIPRSGLVAGNFLSLALNAPLTDLTGLLENRLFEAGKTKKRPDFERALSPDRTVVVIDDTIGSGRAFQETRARIEEAGLAGNFIFCAVYAELDFHPDADVVFEGVGRPVLCEWNIMHDKLLADCCVDIDGVICSNCPPDHDDDGERYLNFLRTVSPLYLPTREIGYLVTGRKEKYRAETEAWMARHNIKYRELVMLDDGKDDHAKHKAEFFGSVNAALFIESEYVQAEEIAKISGKPVLSMETQHLVNPDLGIKSIMQSLKVMPIYVRNSWGGVQHGSFSAMKLRMRKLMGDSTYRSLKRLVRR